MVADSYNKRATEADGCVPSFLYTEPLTSKLFIGVILISHLHTHTHTHTDACMYAHYSVHSLADPTPELVPCLALGLTAGRLQTSGRLVDAIPVQSSKSQ